MFGNILYKKTSFLDYKKSIFEWLQNWNFSKEITQFWSKIGLTEPFSFRTKYFMEIYSVMSGAHQMEPPSPIQALGVNPFPSRFIIRRVPRGDFARRRWEGPITTTK